MENYALELICITKYQQWIKTNTIILVFLLLCKIMVDSLFSAVIQLLQNNVLSKSSNWDNSIVNRGVTSNYSWGHLVLLYTEGPFVVLFWPKTAKKGFSMYSATSWPQLQWYVKDSPDIVALKPDFATLLLDVNFSTFTSHTNSKIRRNKFFF